FSSTLAPTRPLLCRALQSLPRALAPAPCPMNRSSCSPAVSLSLSSSPLPLLRSLLPNWCTWCSPSGHTCAAVSSAFPLSAPLSPISALLLPLQITLHLGR